MYWIHSQRWNLCDVSQGAEKLYRKSLEQLQMNREKKRFWIGFDGFDSFGYNFDTKEEAETYLDKHHTELISYCEHCVEIYDRGDNI